METQELNKAVAKVLGWTDFGITIAEGLMGKPPDRLGYHPVPNWLYDPPACMAPGGPWEWLIESGCWPHLAIAGDEASCAWFHYDEDGLLVEDGETDFFAFAGDPLTACAEAICNAVLAVAAKMTRPVNPYYKGLRNSRWLAFEKGVDAGMAAKNAEWREGILSPGGCGGQGTPGRPMSRGGTGGAGFTPRQRQHDALS